MFKQNPFPKKTKFNPNLNEGIAAREVLTIFPDNNKSVLSLGVAIQRAKELGLDLILVSPNAQPPVCKVADYGQHQYEAKKKSKAAKRNQFIQQIKELKFRPNTDDHDYDFKRKHAVEFLTAGHKVKASVFFKGREVTHSELGKALLMRLVAELASYGTVEGTPRLEGKTAHIIISPVKKS